MLGQLPDHGIKIGIRHRRPQNPSRISALRAGKRADYAIRAATLQSGYQRRGCVLAARADRVPVIMPENGCQERRGSPHTRYAAA
ncbi:hypothetical protein SSBR45G_54280 [Bradyrhizobium sp. SSBR45G]|nr:hypothetical protein SSBR45G_54280 [Bradyrhizobium sp. SSBR45G]GLH87914.1 hypothetical protein SSBR45R_53740 [Bradyrhizobium sp. SSBR45R]